MKCIRNRHVPDALSNSARQQNRVILRTDPADMLLRV